MDNEIPWSAFQPCDPFLRHSNECNGPLQLARYPSNDVHSTHLYSLTTQDVKLQPNQFLRDFPTNEIEQEHRILSLI